MTDLLATIGLKQEELQDRVVEALCEQLLASALSDEDGESVARKSPLRQKLDEEIKKRIDAGVSGIGERHIMPLVASKLESFVIQQTNTWGEAKGAPVTFVEYLVRRADQYMRDEVDSEGRSQPEVSDYNRSSWRKAGTRITQAVDKHLHHNIETAMKTILTDANKTLAEAMKTAVEIKLNEVVKSVKLSVGR